MQEMKSCTSAHWLTLTYNDKHVPVSPNGFMTLSKRHVQLFFKRLRRSMPVGHKPIKYYAVGEYGSQFKRPHYHVVILNADSDLFYDAWRDNLGFYLGDLYCADVTPASIAYTCGYMNKIKTVGKFSRDDRVKEFSLMSKGMGLSYLTPAIVNYHLVDPSRNFVTFDGGRRSSLPRYFRTRIFGTEKTGFTTGCVAIARLNQSFYIEDVQATKHALALNEHIAAYGNADGFVRAQAEGRRAAVVNFHYKHSKRKDL
jgi:hypothetical protein